MSIFKKIKSIDPEENEIISSLGLRPLDYDDENPKDTLDNTQDSLKEDRPSKEAVLSKISDIDVEDVPFEKAQMVEALDNQTDKTSDQIELDDEAMIEPIAEPVAAPIAETITSVAAAPLAPASMLGKETSIKPAHDPVPQFITRDAVERHNQRLDIDPPSFRWMGWVIGISIFLWLLISSAVIFGYFDLGLNWNRLSPIQMAGLVLLVLFPAFLIGIAGYAFRQLAKISTQASELSKAALDLSQPDVSVISKTAIMSAAVKQEIESVDSQIDVALSRMRTLESTLKNQTDSISATHNMTDNVAEKVAQSLSAQRVGLESMADIFDERVAGLNQALKSQFESLETASNLSEQKIDEARIGVEGATAKINAAADFLRSQSLDVTSSMVDNNSEIERLGQMTTERANQLEKIYAKYATEITEMIESLRDEQDNLGLSLENRLSSMREVALSAKTSADNLTKASLSGQQTVTALADAARITDSAVKQRFAEMEDMVKYSNAKAESLSQTATRRVQTSLANTRKEIARIENDMASLQSRLDISETRNPQAPIDAVNPALSQKAAPPKAKAGKTKDRKRKGRLRLKPIEEDFPPVIPPRHTEIEEPKPLAESTENIPQYDDLDALNNLDLKVEDVNYEQDIKKPDIDAHLTQFDPEPAQMPPTDTDLHRDKDIRRTTESTPELRGRARWNWRNLIPGAERDNEVANPLTETPENPQSSHGNEQQIIANLSALGLTPTAIVDDGCIIEATNARKAKGSIAMSQATSHRLSEPVTHLREALEVNAEFKSDLRAFTRQYQNRLNAIANDREAIRTKLESETGRAFLLCDAALNG